MPQLSMHSPIGDLTISEEDGALVSIDWGWSPAQAETPLLRRAKAELEDVFRRHEAAFRPPACSRRQQFPEIGLARHAGNSGRRDP